MAKRVSWIDEVSVREYVPVRPIQYAGLPDVCGDVFLPENAFRVPHHLVRELRRRLKVDRDVLLCAALIARPMDAVHVLALFRSDDPRRIHDRITVTGLVLPREAAEDGRDDSLNLRLVEMYECVDDANALHFLPIADGVAGQLAKAIDCDDDRNNQDVIRGAAPHMAQTQPFVHDRLPSGKSMLPPAIVVGGSYLQTPALD